jgi:hypothetical protein
MCFFYLHPINFLSLSALAPLGLPGFGDPQLRRNPSLSGLLLSSDITSILVQPCTRIITPLVLMEVFSPNPSY